MGFIYDIKSKYSRTCFENLLPNILAFATVWIMRFCVQHLNFHSLKKKAHIKKWISERLLEQGKTATMNIEMDRPFEIGEFQKIVHKMKRQGNRHR